MAIGASDGQVAGKAGIVKELLAQCDALGVESGDRLHRGDRLESIPHWALH